MTAIFIKYIYWHFAIAPGGIMQIMSNYLKANWHRFLIDLHFKTLFAPWHRREPSQLAAKGTKNLGDKMLDSVADAYIRLIAAIIRTAVIVIGLFNEIIITAAFLTLLVLWLLWPLIAALLIIKGILIML